MIGPSKQRAHLEPSVPHRLQKKAPSRISGVALLSFALIAGSLVFVPWQGLLSNTTSAEETGALVQDSAAEAVLAPETNDHRQRTARRLRWSLTLPDRARPWRVRSLF